MADTKISALTAATDLVGSEVAGIQSGVNKRFGIALYDARFAASSHTHTLADITDITASATEVNYTDGVTSSIQTQLDNKQPLDTQLTSLAGLSFSGNALKVVRVDAGENSFELVTLSTGLTHSQVLSLISIRF